MEMIIIGCILMIIGVITFIIGNKKGKINYLIYKQNKELEEINANLTKEKQMLESERDKAFYKLNEVKSMLDFVQEQLNKSKEEFDKAYENYVDIMELAYQSAELEYDTKVKQLEINFDKSKVESFNAFCAYVDTLDEYYIQVEENFDNSLKKITQTIEEYKKDLEKIKQTYAAVKQAQIREEEILKQADFYSLHLTTIEQDTITLINELKPRLPEPRVLCMLIWTTYFQKQMNTLCNNVLGPNTVCGIYKITSKTSGLCYIGQAVDVASRWKTHAKCGLGIDTPAQNKLYRAMISEGLTNFTFELLEECSRDQLNEKEKYYIELYQAYEFGFNSTGGNK